MSDIGASAQVDARAHAHALADGCLAVGPTISSVASAPTPVDHFALGTMFSQKTVQCLWYHA